MCGQGKTAAWSGFKDKGRRRHPEAHSFTTSATGQPSSTTRPVSTPFQGTLFISRIRRANEMSRRNRASSWKGPSCRSIFSTLYRIVL